MVNNVAYELFGDVADKHEEVRNVCLKFAAKNWVRSIVALKKC